MEGGGDRSWWTPLNPDGNKPSVDGITPTIGCHAGESAVLNVQNPQQGFEYRWEKKDPRKIMRAKMRGDIPVLAGDQEYMGLNRMVGLDSASPMDTQDIVGDVVLMRTPIEVMRKRREAEAVEAHKRLHGAYANFIEGGSPEEVEMANHQNLPSLRFARGDHQLANMENGQTRSISRPKGIVRDG